MKTLSKTRPRKKAAPERSRLLLPARADIASHRCVAEHAAQLFRPGFACRPTLALRARLIGDAVMFCAIGA